MQFNQLSEDLQKKFFKENLNKFEPHDEWYEWTVENFVEILEKIGFSEVRVYFSGFGFQGSGAQFVGKYTYKKGVLNNIIKEYPLYTELHDFVKALQVAEKREFYSITFKIMQSGHYSHEYCASFDFEDGRHHYGWCRDSFNEANFIAPCRTFMRHIYDSLEYEYNYLFSEEHALENSDYFSHIDCGEWLENQTQLFHKVA